MDLKQKKKEFNKYYTKYKINTLLRVNGEWLGLHISKVKPKSIEEWSFYIKQNFNRSDKFINAIDYLYSPLKGFNITRGQIVGWINELTIKHTWRGYENELRARQWWIDYLGKDNCEIVDSGYSQDVLKGIDFIVVHSVRGLRTKFYVSVKSGGWIRRHQNVKNKLNKKITDYALKEGGEGVLMIMQDKGRKPLMYNLTKKYKENK